MSWYGWIRVSPECSFNILIVPADVPLVSPPPVVVPLSSSEVLVGWIPPHDNGSVVDLIELQRRRRRVKRSGNRDRGHVDLDNDVGTEYGNIVDKILGRPKTSDTTSRSHKVPLSEFKSEDALAEHLAGVKRRQQMENLKSRSGHAEGETPDDGVVIQDFEGDDSDSDAGAGDGELSWMPDDDWVGIGVDINMDVGDGLPLLMNATDVTMELKTIEDTTSSAVCTICLMRTPVLCLKLWCRFDKKRLIPKNLTDILRLTFMINVLIYGGGLEGYALEHAINLELDHITLLAGDCFQGPLI